MVATPLHQIWESMKQSRDDIGCVREGAGARHASAESLRLGAITIVHGSSFAVRLHGKPSDEDEDLGFQILLLLQSSRTYGALVPENNQNILVDGYLQRKINEN